MVDVLDIDGVVVDVVVVVDVDGVVDVVVVVAVVVVDVEASGIPCLQQESVLRQVS